MEKGKRVKCIYCNKPIHISKFAGITDKGLFCSSIFCLIKFVRDNEEEEK